MVVEETIVLLRASEMTKKRGVGTRANAFLLEDHPLFPPTPLEDIDSDVWRRFRTRIQKSRSAGCRHMIPAYIALIPWVVLMKVGDKLDEANQEQNQRSQSSDQNAGMPAWFIVSFSISTILFVAAIYHAVKEGDGASLRAEAKAVEQMRKTFELQGYDTDHVREYNCGCTACVSCTYVRFRRTGRGKSMPRLQGHEEENSLGSFDAASWAPLEGVWERISCSPSVLQASSSIPDWVSKVAKNTVEISGTHDEHTLALVWTVHVGSWFGLCSKEHTDVGRAQGNTLSLADPKAWDEISATITDETKMLRFQEIRDAMAKEATYYPLPSEASGNLRNGLATYYRNKSGGKVWRVEGSKLLLYYDLEDEWLTDEDILQGCLNESEDREHERKWLEYEYVWDRSPGSAMLQYGTAMLQYGTERTMEASSVDLHSLHFKLAFTGAVQLLAIVIFFASGFAPSETMLFRILLIVTGICGLPNVGYTMTIGSIGESDISRAIVFSGHYLACIVAICIVLGVAWSKSNSGMHAPGNFMLDLFLPVFLIAASANLYFFLQLRTAMKQNRHALYSRLGGGRSEMVQHV